MARLPFKPKWGRFKNRMAVALYFMRRDRRLYGNVLLDEHGEAITDEFGTPIEV